MESTKKSPTSPPSFEYDLSVQRAELLVNSFKPNSVLDVGCRYGYAVQQMKKLIPYARITGIDADPETIEYAKRFCDEGEFFVKEAHRIPEKWRYEWVYCAHTLEHVDDLEEAWNACIKAASKGIVVVVPLETEEQHKKLLEKEASLGTPKWCHHKRRYEYPDAWVSALRRPPIKLSHLTTFPDHKDCLMVWVK